MAVLRHGGRMNACCDVKRTVRSLIAGRSDCGVVSAVCDH